MTKYYMCFSNALIESTMSGIGRKNYLIKEHVNDLFRSLSWLREKADQLQFCAYFGFVKLGFCGIEVK